MPKSGKERSQLSIQEEREEPALAEELLQSAKQEEDGRSPKMERKRLGRERSQQERALVRIKVAERENLGRRKGHLKTKRTNLSNLKGRKAARVLRREARERSRALNRGRGRADGQASAWDAEGAVTLGRQRAAVSGSSSFHGRDQSAAFPPCITIKNVYETIFVFIVYNLFHTINNQGFTTPGEALNAGAGRCFSDLN